LNGVEWKWSGIKNYKFYGVGVEVELIGVEVKEIFLEVFVLYLKIRLINLHILYQYLFEPK